MRTALPRLRSHAVRNPPYCKQHAQRKHIPLTPARSGSTYPFARHQAAGQGTDGAAAQRVIKPHRPVMSRYCRYTFHLRDALDTVDADLDGVGACCGLCRCGAGKGCFFIVGLAGDQIFETTAVCRSV